MAIIQVRNEAALALGGSCEGARGHGVVKVAFAEGLDVGGERQRSQEDSKSFGLSNYRMRRTSSERGKTGRIGFLCVGRSGVQDAC